MRRLVIGVSAILAAVLLVLYFAGTNISQNDRSVSILHLRHTISRLLQITWVILLLAIITLAAAVYFEWIRKKSLATGLQFFKPASNLPNQSSQKKTRLEIQDRNVQDQKTIVREVLKAQENERNKIGQELHDNVNQILASTKLYLHMAYTDHPNNLEYIKTSMEYLDEAVSEIRKLSSREVTPMKELKLQELIEASLKSIQQHSGIKTTFTYLVPDYLLIEGDLKLTLYRIVQEQLNNILKHARACSLTIHMEEKNGCISLTISDDGVGFDPAKVRNGIGISNMINRVTSYNGDIAIDSEPKKGCAIRIKIPLMGTTSQFHSLLHD